MCHSKHPMGITFQNSSQEGDVEMPHSSEKYGLQWLPNPWNPSPRVLPFWIRDDQGIEWQDGLGGLGDCWGIRRTVWAHEFILRFDLYVRSVKKLIDYVYVRTPSPFLQDALEVKQTKFNLLDVFWIRGNDWPFPDAPETDEPTRPRYFLEDPTRPGIVLFVLDKRYPQGSAN